MSDMKKIILWFLVCLFLAVYSKSAGWIPVKMGQSNAGIVLGQQSPYGNFKSGNLPIVK